jgi:hypothetical protein
MRSRFAVTVGLWDNGTLISKGLQDAEVEGFKRLPVLITRLVEGFDVFCKRQ